MKVIKICVDKLPESCGKCQFVEAETNCYTGSKRNYCYLIDEGRDTIPGELDRMCYRRSDCPLCEQASITTASNWTYPSIGIAKLKTDDTTAPFDGTGSVICGGGVKPC